MAVSPGAEAPARPDGAWAEWVAHNLALGVADEAVRAELVRSGHEPAEADALIAETRAAPAFRAAARIAQDVRKWTSLSDVLLDLEREVYDFGPGIPRVADLSREDFLHRYYATNRPVIIEDVVGRWPALHKWSLGFLKERYGDERVRFQKGRGSDHRDSFVDHSQEATLAEYIDLIEGADGETNDYYLIAHDRLLDRPAFRDLFDDVHFDERYLAATRAPGRVFFWLGPPGAMTPLHRDLGNVFFAQIKGRKRVKLIPSKQMHLVYNEVGYHSEVDVEDPSLEEFPLLAQASIMEEVIAPGELLFIPVGWWHSVVSLDVTITVTGNNFAFRNSFTEIF